MRRHATYPRTPTSKPFNPDHTLRQEISLINFFPLSLLLPSKPFNPQPVLHPVPSGTQSPSSASHTAAASSLVGWPPPPHPPAVGFALHGVRICVWTPRVVKTSIEYQHQCLPPLPWEVLADGWRVGGQSCPPQDGCRRAERERDR